MLPKIFQGMFIMVHIFISHVFLLLLNSVVSSFHVFLHSLVVVHYDYLAPCKARLIFFVHNVAHALALPSVSAATFVSGTGKCCFCSLAHVFALNCLNFTA